MSMRDERESRLDEAIDDVACALTSGGPRPAFHESVRARLQAQPGGAGPRAGWYAAAAVVAVIVIAVVSWSPNREAGEEVSMPGSDVVDAEPAPPVAPLVAPPSVVDVVRPPTASAVAAAVPVPAPVEELVHVDLLDVMPLYVEPLEIPMIAVDAISVDPLVMQ
jgi:hypothetical protein